MANYINSILDTIGSTPVLKLNKIKQEYNSANNMFIKMEIFNPYGSIKDRIALSMITAAEKKNLISPDKTTLIESTSGNTGISLAAIGIQKGYKVVIVMPENASLERQKLIKYIGAELILSPKKLGRTGALEIVKNLVKTKENYVWLNQYENIANPDIHYKQTAQEIWNDLDGKIDIFISGLGTGGTVNGIGKYLKEQNPEIKIFAVVPKEKDNNKIEGLHSILNSPDEYAPSTLDLKNVDRIIEVRNEDAIKFTKNLKNIEGILAGISTGANLKAALDIDKEYKNKNIVFINQDNVFRYMSTELFE